MGAGAEGPSETCKDLTAHIYFSNLIKSMTNLVDFFLPALHFFIFNGLAL